MLRALLEEFAHLVFDPASFGLHPVQRTSRGRGKVSAQRGRRGSILLYLDNHSAFRSPGGNTLIRLDSIPHLKDRVNRHPELAFLHHLHQHKSVVLSWRRREHDIPSWDASEICWTPGIHGPIPERSADSFHTSNVNDGAVRVEI